MRNVYWLAAFVFFALMVVVALRIKPKPIRTKPPPAPVATAPIVEELPPEPPFGPLKMPDSELPCDVDQVLADKCRRCHASPGRHGAPLIFYKWSELHAEYLGEPVYKRLGRAVQTGFMPNQIPANPKVQPLSPAEKQTLLDWVAAGAPRGSCGAPEASASASASVGTKAKAPARGAELRQRQPGGAAPKTSASPVSPGTSMPRPSATAE